eukprot:gene8556-biopygen10658
MAAPQAPPGRKNEELTAPQALPGATTCKPTTLCSVTWIQCGPGTRGPGPGSGALNCTFLTAPCLNLPYTILPDAAPHGAFVLVEHLQKCVKPTGIM